jgi:CheY-like chemotaxis protein
MLDWTPFLVETTPGKDVATAKTKLNVLVVDDDASVRDMIATFLSLEGFEVETAGDGAEALEAVTRQRPTLVVLDMNMPVVDGGEFIRRLRDDGVDLPVVAMTAARHAQQWAKEIGAAAYVAKPINLPLLLARIDRLAAA